MMYIVIIILQCAVDGFIKCWIDMDNESTSISQQQQQQQINKKNKPNDPEKEDLCSFMHLVTKYNRVHLMQHTLVLFPDFTKVRYKFVYIRCLFLLCFCISYTAFGECIC